MNKDSNENKMYFRKYRLDNKICEGPFGEMYIAINIFTNKKYALKLDPKMSNNVLEREAIMMSSLKGTGIPYLKSYGLSGGKKVMVMELLNKSLEDLFQEVGCKFSLMTVCILGLQMLDRIEYIHSKYFIHRDIKPENFVMGIGAKEHTVFIIDFGKTKKFRSAKTSEHISLKNNNNLILTDKFASINSLKGMEQSRRDDLESLGYVIMYLIRGSLPWQGLNIDENDDISKKIFNKKQNTTTEELCKGYPKEFSKFINYTRNLTFKQDPDYNFLRCLIKMVLMDESSIREFIDFEWEVNKRSIGKSINHLEPNTINIDKIICQDVNLNKNLYYNKNSNSRKISTMSNSKVIKASTYPNPLKKLDSFDNEYTLRVNKSLETEILIQNISEQLIRFKDPKRLDNTCMQNRNRSIQLVSINLNPLLNSVKKIITTEEENLKNNDIISYSITQQFENKSIDKTINNPKEKKNNKNKVNCKCIII